MKDVDAELAIKRGPGLKDLPQESKRRIYQAMIFMARRPAGIVDADQVILNTYAKILGLEAEAEALAEQAVGERVGLGKGASERDALLTALVDLAAADGVVDDRERRRLKRIFEKLGVDESGIFPSVEDIG
jgi:uncharacterized membrane protein YebE (DUF533 family)